MMPIKSQKVAAMIASAIFHGRSGRNNGNAIAGRSITNKITPVTTLMVAGSLTKKIGPSRTLIVGVGTVAENRFCSNESNCRKGSRVELLLGIFPEDGFTYLFGGFAAVFDFQDAGGFQLVELFEDEFGDVEFEAGAFEF